MKGKIVKKSVKCKAPTLTLAGKILYIGGSPEQFKDKPHIVFGAEEGILYLNLLSEKSHYDAYTLTRRNTISAVNVQKECGFEDGRYPLHMLDENTLFIQRKERE